MSFNSDGLQPSNQAGNMDPTPETQLTPVQVQDVAASASSKVKLPKTFINRTNSGICVSFLEPYQAHKGNQVHCLEEQEKPKSYHDLIVTEASKVVRGVMVSGNPYVRNLLFRLPIELRFKIYEYLFIHDGSAIEIGRQSHTPMGNTSILRVCHAIYHEASIALYHSMSHRKLFFRTYGSFSADVLNRRPSPLQCCRNMSYQKWLEYPCVVRELSWKRSIHSVVFLIGALDFMMALKRRWAFSEFITTLRMGDHMRIYSLTVVAAQNWKMPGFDENDLVQALFSGAIMYLGKLTFRGFSNKERDRLWAWIFTLDL
ncbi:hypothetical protein AWENTII_000435 [Aspergillus wentii]